MGPYAPRVVVCVVKGRGRGTLDKHGAQKVVSSGLLEDTDTQSGSVYPHSGCLCCEEGGGEPLINMGSLKLFSSSFLRRFDPHSGSMYPHSGCLYYEGVEGENPDNHGALEVVFQCSSSCHWGIDPHSASLCLHTGCLYCEGGGEPLINMGSSKLFSSSF